MEWRYIYQKGMKMKHTKLIAICLVIGMNLPVNAYAYIDPGSGSLMLQMLIAGIIGAFVTIKLYWMQLRARISRMFKRIKGI